MKPLFFPLTIILTTLIAAVSAMGRDSVIERFPACAAGCLVYNMKTAGCVSFSPYCLCTRRPEVMSGAIPCVRERCESRDQLVFVVALYTTCGVLGGLADGTGGLGDGGIAVLGAHEMIPVASETLEGTQRREKRVLNSATLPSPLAGGYASLDYSGGLVKVTTPTLAPQPPTPLVSCSIPTLSSGPEVPQPIPTPPPSTVTPSSAAGPPPRSTTTNLTSSASRPFATAPPPYNASGASTTLGLPARSTTASLPDYTAAAAVRRPAYGLGMLAVLGILL